MTDASATRTVPVPRYVDSQYQFLMWEIDQVAPFIAVFALGLLTDTLTYLLVPAFLLSHLFARYKHARLDGILQHLAYHWGLLALNKRFRYGSIRHYEQ